MNILRGLQIGMNAPSTPPPFNSKKVNKQQASSQRSATEASKKYISKIL